MFAQELVRRALSEQQLALPAAAQHKMWPVGVSRIAGYY
jgi:hypothetical protein